MDERYCYMNKAWSYTAARTQFWKKLNCWQKGPAICIKFALRYHYSNIS